MNFERRKITKSSQIYFRENDLITLEDKNKFIKTVFKAARDGDLFPSDDEKNGGVLILCEIYEQELESDEDYRNRLNVLKSNLEMQVRLLDSVEEQVNQINQNLEKLNNK